MSVTDEKEEQCSGVSFRSVCLQIMEISCPGRQDCPLLNSVQSPFFWLKSGSARLEPEAIHVSWRPPNTGPGGRGAVPYEA